MLPKVTRKEFLPESQLVICSQVKEQAGITIINYCLVNIVFLWQISQETKWIF